MKKLVLYSFLISFCWGCGKVPTAEPSQPFDSFVGDFEQGSLTGFHFLVSNQNLNTQVITSPVRKGAYALKNLLRSEDYVFNGYRTELALYNCAKYKTEVFYAFSFLIDTAYKDNAYNLLCQWQDLPNYQQGEDFATTPVLHGSPPPLALVYTDGKVELKINTNPTSSNETVNIGSAIPLTKGIWYDVVFHIFWSDEKDGYTEAWLNGNPISNGKYFKPNLYNRTGNYFKFGQYRGKDKTEHTNIVYFDEVKIGRSYNEVAP